MEASAMLIILNCVLDPIELKGDYYPGFSLINRSGLDLLEVCQSYWWLRISSVVGGEGVVNHVLSVLLSGHPVTEEEGGEEWDEANVDASEALGPDVKEPADNPWVLENTFNLLKISIWIYHSCTYHFECLLNFKCFV